MSGHCHQHHHQHNAQRAPSSGGSGSETSEATRGNAFAQEQLSEQDQHAAEGNAADSLEAFLASGPYGPELMLPPSGGGFDAEYDPGTGRFGVRVQGSVDFIDGLEYSSGTFTSNNEDLDQAAIDGNNLPDAAARDAFAETFQWAGQQAEWIEKVRANIESVWTGQFTFAVDRPGWEGALAYVDVELDVVWAETRDGDHLSMEVYKCPDDGSADVGAYVWGGGADGSGMVVSSRDAMTHEERTEAGDSMLQNWVGPFESGSDSLPAEAAADLDALIADFRDAGKDGTNPVTITGHSTSEGMARRRAEAVADYLKSAGMAPNQIRVATAPVEGEDGWAWVDLTVGDGRAQDVAAHEFGHVLGLADHYDNAGVDDDGDGVADRGGTISGSGAPAGTATGHDDLARQIGVTGGAVHENNDGLMSLGANVEASNYSTIGWALQSLTRIPEWRIQS